MGTHTHKAATSLFLKNSVFPIHMGTSKTVWKIFTWESVLKISCFCGLDVQTKNTKEIHNSVDGTCDCGVESSTVWEIFRNNDLFAST